MQRVADLQVAPGKQLIAGVDEAGRGPLAGAVMAAAVILPAQYDLPGLNDSKKLSESRRERLFELIQAQAVSYAIVAVAATEIDRINILQATLQAMKKAVTALATQPDFVYVDGNRCPLWSYASEALVQGDSRLDCIAAASILAKVARDRTMADMEQRYPGYGFARHKGYPTSAHMSALQLLGPCPEHRRSYAPVARCLAALNEHASEQAQ
jgi:ribonuclease HII